MRRDEWLQVWLGRHDCLIQRHGRSSGNCPWHLWRRTCGDEWLQVWLDRHDRPTQCYGGRSGNCPWHHFSDTIFPTPGAPGG